MTQEDALRWLDGRSQWGIAKLYPGDEMDALILALHGVKEVDGAWRTWDGRELKRGVLRPSRSLSDAMLCATNWSKSVRQAYAGTVHVVYSPRHAAWYTSMGISGIREAYTRCRGDGETPILSLCRALIGVVRAVRLAGVERFCPWLPQKAKVV